MSVIQNPWRGLRALPREVWILCLATLVNRAGTMVLPFLTLYLTVERRFSAATAGLALTIYGIAAIVIAPLSGRLSDRLGGLRIIKLSLFLSAVVLFIFPFAHSLTSILVMTGVWAIVNEAFRPPSMSIIGDLAGPAQRKAAFALSRLAINLGMSIGPVVGGFLAMRSFKLLFYVDGTTALLAGLILVLVPWRPGKPALSENNSASIELPANVSTAGIRSSTVLPYSSVLNDRRFLYFLAAMLPVELVFFQTLAAMPLFLVRDLHMTEAGFGMLLAINTVLIIVIEVPLNAAMADWSNRHALALGALLIGLGFGGMALDGGVLWLSLTVVVWTFGEMILLPASAAEVSDVAPPAQSGAYMGLYSMGFSVAFAIGPMLGVQTMERFGSSAVWIGTFICGCLTATMIWFARTKNDLSAVSSGTAPTPGP
ncbi:MAG: MFS transporter [Pyrinomonadaceae bacterium]|nr:MFS transporter [Pyrinomonadaceae bacterium]